MNVETDKIVLDLNRRFAAPLSEFYERRILGSWQFICC